MSSLLSVYAERTFASLHIRNYRLYFIGQALSMSGTWMQSIALGWLVLILTGSGTALGLVMAAQFGPMFFLGPWGGVIVDRFDKRSLLLVTQTAFAVLALGISIIILADRVELWMLYIYAFLFGLVRVFDNPGRQSFVSEMVDEAHLKNAISLNATLNNTARAVGPSIAGIIIATVSIGFCFLFNAISYIGTIGALVMMERAALSPSEPTGKRSGQLVAGLRYAWSVPTIRYTLLMMAIIGTFTYEFQVTLPLIAQHTFAAGAGAYAALMSAFGVGSMLGGLFSAGRHRVAARHLLGFVLLFGISILFASVMPSLLLAIVAMFVVGFFSINVLSLANTTVQLQSAPEMRGRVMALWSTAMIGSTFFGGPAVGWVGEFLGPRWGLALSGIAAIIAAAAAARYLLRSDEAREVPESVARESDEATAQQVRVR